MKKLEVELKFVVLCPEENVNMNIQVQLQTMFHKEIGPFVFVTIKNQTCSLAIADALFFFIAMLFMFTQAPMLFMLKFLPVHKIWSKGAVRS